MKQKPTDLKEEMNKSAIRVISVTLWTVCVSMYLGQSVYHRRAAQYYQPPSN